MYSFEDWLRFTKQGVLLLTASIVLVFVLVTLSLWVYDLVVQPVLSPSTTRVFGVPSSASGWLVLAAWGVFIAAGLLFGAGVVCCNFSGKSICWHHLQSA